MNDEYEISSENIDQWRKDSQRSLRERLQRLLEKLWERSLKVEETE